VFICPPSHPFAKKDQVNVQELTNLPFLCREEGSGTREFINSYLERNGLQQNDLSLCMEFGSPEAIKSAVEAGLGVSIVSRATVAKELKLKTLVALPLKPKLERPFSFVHQRQKFRLSAVDEFMEFMHEHCIKTGTGAKSAKAG